MRPLPFYLIFLEPVSVVQSYVMGGWFTLSTPVWVFGAIPLLDLIIGKSVKNPTPEQVLRFKDAFEFKVITWFCALLQVTIVFWGAHAIAKGGLNFWEAIGFTLSMGTSSGVMGINVSHELQHRINNRFEPLLSRFMLWTVGYMHWAIEHVAGHHRNVATPHDPATARFGESFYAFWPRTVVGGFKSAWSIEAKRLEKKGGHIWSLRNRILTYGAAELALLFFFWIFFGPAAAAYFVRQRLCAVSMLEVVNTIEHYGL
jgi:alkane 1-monooxygenase